MLQCHLEDFIGLFWGHVLDSQSHIGPFCACPEVDSLCRAMLLFCSHIERRPGPCCSCVFRIKMPLELFCGRVQPSRGIRVSLGPLGGHVGASCGFRACLAAVWGFLGPSLGSLGLFLGHHAVVFFWRPETSWRYLGPILTSTSAPATAHEGPRKPT